MAMRNFNEFDYPKNKLEWVILDDSKYSMEEIDHLRILCVP